MFKFIMNQDRLDISQIFKRLTKVLSELTSNSENEIDPDSSLQTDLNLNFEDSLEELTAVINREFNSDNIMITSSDLLDEFEKYGDAVTTLVAIVQERLEFD